MPCGHHDEMQCNGAPSQWHYPSAIHRRFDPLYELVRQTMLVESVIKSKDDKLLADDYLHINVIPEGNIELRSDIGHYSEGLKDNGKFVLVSPKQLMQPIKETHQDLYNYLETRYWQ